MATAAEASAVTAQQTAQATISASLAADMANAFLLVHQDNLTGSLPQWKLAVSALVQRYSRISAHLAGQFYRQQRLNAGVGRITRLPPVALPPMQQIDVSLDWASRGLWSAEPTPQVVQSVATGVAQKLVVGTGRGQIITAVEADRKALGYARVARPGACSFCLLLATRGAVYKTGRSATTTKAGQSYHDNCHCMPEPLFSGDYTPPEHIEKARQLYYSSTRGLSGAEARKAFRRAVEADAQ